jgi:large subunit ribosomal protein L35
LTKAGNILSYPFCNFSRVSGIGLRRVVFMPKQKTHKGLAKRVKVTASGKVKYRKSFGGHLMSGKTAKRRRQIGKAGVSTGTVAEKIKTKLCV